MDLTLTLIQPDIVWEDAAANREAYSDLLQKVPAESQLIILPEMFSTGFTMHAEKVAEEMDGPTIRWMREEAARLDAVICGSIVVREEGNFYNRLIWMRGDGTFSQYDKRHLFSMAGEEQVYSAGKERLITSIGNWWICPQVCYDLRFPVWSRNVEEYHLYINVANWPQRRNYPWKTLLAARAIENQAYAVGVNRIGNDGNGVYHSGDSSVIDPLGEVLHRVSDEVAVKTVTLSWDHMQEARKKFPFLQDRDRFTIDA